MQASLVTLIETDTDLKYELRHEFDEVLRDLNFYVDIELGNRTVDISACLSIFGDLQHTIIFEWNHIISVDGMLVGRETDPPVQGFLEWFNAWVTLENQTSLQNVTFRNEGVIR